MKKLYIKLAQRTIRSFVTSSACYFLIKENMTSMQKCQLRSLVTYHKITIYRRQQKKTRALPRNENNCAPFSRYFSVRIKSDALHKNSFLLVIVSEGLRFVKSANNSLWRFPNRTLQLLKRAPPRRISTGKMPFAIQETESKYMYLKFHNNSPTLPIKLIRQRT